MSNIEIFLNLEKKEIKDTIKDICSEINQMRKKVKQFEEKIEKKSEDENKEQNNKLIEEIKNVKEENINLVRNKNIKRGS